MSHFLKQFQTSKNDDGLLQQQSQKQKTKQKHRIQTITILPQVSNVDEVCPPCNQNNSKNNNNHDNKQ